MDVRAFYLAHDGFERGILSLAEARNAYLVCVQISRPNWHKGWLPIYFFGDDWAYLDLRPGRGHGAAWEAWNDSPTATMRSRSLAHYLVTDFSWGEWEVTV